MIGVVKLQENHGIREGERKRMGTEGRGVGYGDGGAIIANDGMVRGMRRKRRKRRRRRRRGGG
jgi:hypothetical protein